MSASRLRRRGRREFAGDTREQPPVPPPEPPIPPPEPPVPSPEPPVPPPVPEPPPEPQPVPQWVGPDPRAQLGNVEQRVCRDCLEPPHTEHAS